MSLEVNFKLRVFFSVDSTFVQSALTLITKTNQTSKNCSQLFLLAITHVSVEQSLYAIRCIQNLIRPNYHNEALVNSTISINQEYFLISALTSASCWRYGSKNSFSPSFKHISFDFLAYSSPVIFCFISLWLQDRDKSSISFTL